MHAEAVEIVYDEKVVSARTLIDLLWQIHDPTTLNRQGGDRGTQYRMRTSGTRRTRSAPRSRRRRPRTRRRCPRLAAQS